MTVELLDYSNLPAGYTIVFDDGERDSDETGPGWRDADCIGWYFTDGGNEVANDGSPMPTEGEALAAAWAHYKARRNPPGLDVFVWPKEKASDPPTVWCAAPRSKPHFASFVETDTEGEAEDAARSAAWAWYDRRHALARRSWRPLEPRAWPVLLTWPDEQVAAAEAGSQP